MLSRAVLSPYDCHFRESIANSRNRSSGLSDRVKSKYTLVSISAFKTVLPYDYRMTWLAIVGTLLGALIGAAAALVAQQLAARDAVERERTQRRAAMRVELKERIDSYINAAQETERIAKEREKNDDAAKNLVHRDLYAANKILGLTCSDQLKVPMDELTDVLVRILWHGPGSPDSLYDQIRLKDGEFHKAAKREIQWVES